jgi:hypothetical protein
LRRLREVTRHAAQLALDVVGIDREAAGLEEGDPLADGPRGGLGVEVDRDIGDGALREPGETLIVERGDGPEARVLAGELSPAGAGLVDIERARQTDQRWVNAMAEKNVE